MKLISRNGSVRFRFSVRNISIVCGVGVVKVNFRVGFMNGVMYGLVIM